MCIRDRYGFEDEGRLVLVQKGRHCPRGFSVSHVVLSFSYVVVQLESMVSAVMSVHVALKKGDLVGAAAGKGCRGFLEEAPLRWGGAVHLAAESPTIAKSQLSILTIVGTIAI